MNVQLISIFILLSLFVSLLLVMKFLYCQQDEVINLLIESLDLPYQYFYIS